MHHVAIMKKSWKLIPKILSGEKKIESRWYKTRCEAWDKVKAGDTVWFKNSGDPVTVRAEVSKVVQFEGLTLKRVREILNRWGGKDGIAVTDVERTIEWARDKKYCVLIFLENVSPVDPFSVNKKGFGSARAWLSAENISDLRIP
jgi:ASC-1-like (ASCH) protein